MKACKPKKCKFRVVLGAGGLTKAALRLYSGVKAPPRELAKLAGVDFVLKDVPEVEEALGDRHIHVDYSVDARGYSVALGFALPRAA